VSDNGKFHGVVLKSCSLATDDNTNDHARYNIDNANRNGNDNC